ncbi:nuclear transport factor 2 family protein [Novosphingobium pentaromativorans]|uniref:SnoaL-like domain-containing protein n=1 Tax=Novosphingobium pentaromativorans US6-1 TaxID=1088721 RepID=G6EAU8_9SPHN|nr:nuclear transport factor 2 family protein [Novosphingobium pentaromativorans]AIT80564.1 hypothetical protein JI59_12685 [Novosphingobium pentaromativorans US6-1]EHJ61735.1 hypothetical protein NSU_1496 [Novosphingobium pentaromativorans US6-1]
MNEGERALAIAEIRSLKARYWHCVDLRDAEGLRACFADDAVIPAHGDIRETRDADGFVANLVASLRVTRSLHLGGPGDIALESADRARGVWAVEDRIWALDGVTNTPFRTLHGWGHYHDEYVRTAKGWRIQSFRLDRVRVDIT